MSKQYQLISSEPLTEFEESFLRVLHELAEANFHPKSMCGVIQTEEREVMTFYHSATLQDKMIARGYLDLDIVNDNTLGNLPFYMEQAEKDGLIEAGEEENEDDWEG